MGFKARLLALGVAFTSATSLQADIAQSERKSSYDMMAPQTRAMQDDDTSNPAMLSALDGEVLWNRRTGETEKSCADCHGDARQSMRGMAARYPAHDPATRRVVDLEERIGLCQAREQKATPFARETRDMLALSTRARD
jgi:sulfur-oxidizing protein SoxA